MIVHLVFALVVVLGANWLFKALSGGKISLLKDALSALKRCYVQGEITNEEFQRMKQELE